MVDKIGHFDGDSNKGLVPCCREQPGAGRVDRYEGILAVSGNFLGGVWLEVFGQRFEAEPVEHPVHEVSKLVVSDGGQCNARHPDQELPASFRGEKPGHSHECRDLAWGRAAVGQVTSLTVQDVVELW